MYCVRTYGGHELVVEFGGQQRVGQVAQVLLDGGGENVRAEAGEIGRGQRPGRSAVARAQALLQLQLGIGGRS